MPEINPTNPETSKAIADLRGGRALVEVANDAITAHLRDLSPVQLAHLSHEIDSASNQRYSLEDSIYRRKPSGVTTEARELAERLSAGGDLVAIALDALKNNMRDLSAEQRGALCDAVKSARKAIPFEVAVDLEHGRLEVRRGVDGPWECKLVLKDVASGSTQEKAQALCEEINQKLRELPHYPAPSVGGGTRSSSKDTGFQIRLSNNGDLPTGAGDITIQGYPLVNDSIERHRTKTRFIRGQRRESQGALLEACDLVEMPNDAVRLMVGLFRLWKGFPEHSADLFTEVRDKGDLLEGYSVRTRKGPHSSVVIPKVFALSEALQMSLEGNWLAKVFTNWGLARKDMGIAGGVA